MVANISNKNIPDWWRLLIITVKINTVGRVLPSIHYFRYFPLQQMLNSAGASIWHNVAIGTVRTRQTFILSQLKSTQHHVPLTHGMGWSRSLLPSRTLTMFVRRSLRAKSKSAGINMLSVVREQTYRASPIANGLRHTFTTGANVHSVDDKKDALPSAIVPRTWLDRMPESVQPYLYLTRIDKPIGTWLLFWPCGN
jgi:hypothetical protein